MKTRKHNGIITDRVFQKALFLCALAGFISLSIVQSGCKDAASKSTHTDPAQRYISAFIAHRYSEALETAENELVRNPLDGAWQNYRAASLAMLGESEDAVEAFLVSDIQSRGRQMDQTSMFLRARALSEIKAYSRAMETLNSLMLAFPDTRLADQAGKLESRIQNLIGRDVTEKTINWYADAGMRAYNAARPALAAELLEEYRLLTFRAGAEPAALRNSTRMTLGGAYLELAAPERTSAVLEDVPPAHDNYRAGLLKALAMRNSGKSDEALALLKEVLSNSSDFEVLGRSQKLYATCLLTQEHNKE